MTTHGPVQTCSLRDPPYPLSVNGKLKEIKPFKAIHCGFLFQKVSSEF